MATFLSPRGGGPSILISTETVRRPPTDEPQAPPRTASLAPLATVPACVRLGPPTGEAHDCVRCGGGKSVPVRQCTLHGECTSSSQLTAKVDGQLKDFHWCVTCQDHQAAVPVVESRAVARLPTGPDNQGFNSSLIRWQGRLLLAYRTGWRGSEIRIAELSESYSPGAVHALRLHHPRANYGREDPRLFIHNGDLWLSYIGVRGGQQLIDTHQMLARLTPDLRVAEVVYPHYPKRQAWEKNWQFFSFEGQLFAVYQIHPHTVLRIDGNRAEVAHHTDWQHRWSGGMLRGGASPVLVGDRFWCFFHGKIQPRYNYSIGVYCFEATPPFRPICYTPDPILWANRKTKPKDQYCPVVFPCGAVLDDGIWHVSCGIHDRWTEILDFRHEDIERIMVQV